jgi:hypothetical protein
MLCPYCQVQYTPEEPCFCQPRVVNQRTGAVHAPEAQSKSEGLSASRDSFYQYYEMLCAEPER